jgi:hypothetical protein
MSERREIDQSSTGLPLSSKSLYRGAAWTSESSLDFCDGGETSADALAGSAAPGSGGLADLQRDAAGGVLWVGMCKADIRA